MRTFAGLSQRCCVYLGLWVLYLLVALILNPQQAWLYVALTVACLALYLLKYFKGKGTISVPATPPAVCHAVLAALSLLAVAIVVWQIVVAPSPAERMGRAQSTGGFCLLVGGSVATSKKRANIDWRLVVAGLLCQFYMGLFVFRSKAGFRFFQAMGDSVGAFLDLTDVGSQFVFGDSFKDHFFVFDVLPKTIFFSSFCSCMYYLGVLQATVNVIAVVLKWALGSSTPESVNAAGNIFLGQTEAPLLVRTILPQASPSEIHCIMTGGFATVAGGVLAAYIGMGVSANQLIGASVMSAPAALTISKIVCPSGVKVEKKVVEGTVYSNADDSEDQEVGTAASPIDGEEVTSESSEDSDDDSLKGAPEEDFRFPAPIERNIVEAAASGASIAIGLVANIAAMLIAFLALITLMDSTLERLGDMVSIPNLSTQTICARVFYPVAWLLGSPLEDCGAVAQLIGTKIFVNEFVAYSRLSELIKATPRGITPRGELIATYALCGFSNFGSIGIQVGGLSAICPERKDVFYALVVSAMIAGNTCCFLTATVAGILQ